MTQIGANNVEARDHMVSNKDMEKESYATFFS